ncbi:MAG: pyruvate dehydrogenase complex dihydrolipoamide acetyltransferase [Alphaproteobacteria bacterium]|nr:pyruvate dehydrogenase complex dihydrolipoamide acetyltransferase [Alphaproteobacteria bacterium]
MPIALRMPALSPTMTDGTIARWLVKEGEAVTSGTLLAEIETDKAVMEYESIDEGTLGRIDIPAESENIAVGTVIGWVLEPNESAATLPALGNDSSAPSASSVAASTAPAVASGAIVPSVPPSTVAASAEVAPAPVGGATSTTHSRVFASPLARRLAREAGVDIAAIKGTGPHGRIVKRDVLAYEPPVPMAASAPMVASSPAATSTPHTPEGAAHIPPSRIEKPSTMRRIIAERLQESKQKVPHFYLTVEIDVDPLLAIRRQINETLVDGKVSVNDFVIKSVAVALEQIPAANASWSDAGMMTYYERSDIAVAVAIDGGLITPVVRDAANKRLAVIAQEMKELAARARAGKLTPTEYSNGTFSISNLGMFGVKEFAAVINPPQGCILAVGAGEKRPVVRNGELAIATMMSVTLSADHRAVDGAVAAQWLGAFKKLMENPLAML